MQSIPVARSLAQLPAAELEQTLNRFLAPMQAILPDARLRRVLPLAVAGILASQSPQVTRMAQPVSRRLVGKVSAAAKRIYRLLGNRRISARRLTRGLYRLAQATVAAEAPPYLVVALDPVRFEKPYTHKLPGVCTVLSLPRPTVTARLGWLVAIPPSQLPSSTLAWRPLPMPAGSPTSSTLTAKTTNCATRCA
ncbi:MAG: hypothetical protein ACR2M0_09465 [Chloroflexia bacterium]